MRIYLIGYMASGKSFLGSLLAEKLGFEFIDLDYLFEERYRINVADFFEKYDEGIFRKIERSLLHETAGFDDVVVSTGGGTPCFFDNMEFIKQSGISIYLCQTVPELVSRRKGVKRKRPLLRDIPLAELEAKVASQLAERAFFYNQADMVISGEDSDPDKLLQLLRSRMKSN